MKNPNDYNAGWTKSLGNVHGGAARNMRISQKGGVQRIIEDAVKVGVIAGVSHAIASLKISRPHP